MKVTELIEELNKLDPDLEIEAETEHGNVRIMGLKIVPKWELDIKERKPVFKDEILICTDWASVIPYNED